MNLRTSIHVSSLHFSAPSFPSSCWGVLIFRWPFLFLQKEGIQIFFTVGLKEVNRRDVDIVGTRLVHYLST